MDPYLLPAEPVADLDDHLARGGGAGLEAARALGPAATIDEVTASGLRGRGGGGFPTGRKWSSVASGGPEAGDRYVVVNGAEGEPGTFKDRAILRADPYQVIEGALVAAHAVGAREVIVALKASFEVEADRVQRALDEIDDAGFSGGVSTRLVLGPDEYLFGEEKALLEVIEGEDPLPRLFPPYEYGLYSTAPQVGWSAGEDRSSTGPTVPSSNPTVVNNVESLAHAGHVLARGADWFRARGSHDTPGHLVVTVSGDVRHAAVAEVEAGRPLGEVLDELGGGVAGGHELKAVLSGVANGVIVPSMLDTPLGFDAMAAAGTGLGSAGFVVFDDRRNMVDVAASVSTFLAVESCGQCPACKLGTAEVTGALNELRRGGGGAPALERLRARLSSVTDAARCYLPTQEQQVVASILTSFPDDLAARSEGARAPGVGDEPLVAKLVDIVDGEAVLDDRQRYKRPDWTYADQPVEITGA